MDAVPHFSAMARNVAFANHRLLNACAGLPCEAFAAPRTGFFPSLRASLNPIPVVDWFYVDAMESGTLGPAACAAVDRRVIAGVAAMGGGGPGAHRTDPPPGPCPARPVRPAV